MRSYKDRYTILSQQCLGFLRDYWRNFRPSHPEGLLFPGCKNVSHITDRAINQALKKWLTAAGISKNISMHSLRHGFATHLLEDGVDIFTIKELLGHRSISSNHVKLMPLDAEEFIRRFLLHVLPFGFRKIRHYGLFASRDKGKRLALCRRLTNSSQPAPMLPVTALLDKIFGKDFNLCPCCKVGHFAREPPLQND